MDNTELLMDIIGWVGAVSLLSAYLLISNGKTHGKAFLYQGLNITGSAGILINSYYFGAMPSVILNVIWIMIGVHALGLFSKRKDISNE